MRKISKLIFALVVIIAFSMRLPVFATTANTTTNEAFITIAATNSSTENDSSTTVSAVPGEQDNELSIPDILNILLIATGVVIILLAIAIFVKLK